jgi:hypothetical protein
MVAFIRPSSRSGVSPCRKLTWTMLYTTAPNENTRKPNVAAPSNQPRWASGMNTPKGDVMAIDVQIAGPWPSHFAIRVAVSAPTSPPIAPNEKTRPIVPAARWRSRASNTIIIAPVIAEKKLDDPVHIEIDRSSRLPSTNRNPSRISRPRWASGARAGTGSRLRIRPTNSAEPAKLTASTRTATGAVSHWITRPATAGPAIWLTPRTASSFALPSTRLVRPTRCGR